MQYRLMEKKPAALFEDAYLLGNGSLGASVYGGVPTEEILLNHDTLWSGQEKTCVKEHFYEQFLRAQRLTLEGDYRAANDVINNDMEGIWGQAYMPLASAYLTIGQGDDRRNMRLRRVLLTDEDPYTDYQRELLLREALSRVGYERGGVRYTRELFVSHPAQVAALRLTAEGGELCFALSLDSKLRHVYDAQECQAYLTGVAPDHAEPSYTSVKPALVYHAEEKSNALRFAACARVADTDGSVRCDGARVYVTGASYATVLLAADTNYAGYKQPRSKDASVILRRLEERLDNAARKGYGALREEHIADVTALYDACSVDLGQPLTDGMPTSQRLSLCAERVDDPSLCALALQYARYLTIAGSRPGSQAMNLQGIWNDSTNPPWASNYTTNINVQMNYWPCETLGLGQCHQPLVRMVEELSDDGKNTARDFYHARGWVAHHNVDLWRLSAPSCEDATWSWWPFAGVWLCQHLWTHYEYTQDKAYLRQIYPVLREAAQFLLDFMVEDSGEWVTAPSISPENKHLYAPAASYNDVVANVNPENRFSANLPQVAAVTKSSTMDVTLTRELFGHVQAACGILGMEDPLLGDIAQVLPKLPPFKIGRYGQLQEWYDDEEECMPGMGHMSHLVGVYPGEVIREDNYPQAFEGARMSLLRRTAHGGLTAHWPGAWAVCLGARLGLKELCARTVRTIGGRLSANLLTQSSVQIDSIFGWAAGIAEMLLQSQGGVIRVLPCLSPSWRNGSFKGMQARGGYTVDAAWQSGKLATGAILAHHGGLCRVQAPGLTGLQLPDGQVLPAQNGQVEWACQAGQKAEMLFA